MERVIFDPFKTPSDIPSLATSRSTRITGQSSQKSQSPRSPRTSRLSLIVDTPNSDQLYKTSEHTIDFDTKPR